MCEQVRRKDSSMESVRIDRPKQTVPTPVDAFLEERGDRKVLFRPDTYHANRPMLSFQG